VQLCFMRRQYGGRSLDLRNYRARDDDIGPEALADRLALANHRDRNLTFAPCARRPQFMIQTLFINRCKQSPPRIPMHLDRQPNDPFREFPAISMRTDACGPPWPAALPP